MRMSGIATLTNDLLMRCRAVNPEIRIAATRKTTPGFREFEKRAVSIGGGDPHRFGLDDAILIKDNHIRLAGSVKEALRRARASSFTKKIEIEVESEDDALAAVEGGADIIMLDNLAPEEAQALYARIKSQRPNVMIETSGGIRPDNVEKYARGADIISLGWITHSVKSVDFSMSIEPA
jgi:nicotinate-nucleotide pyrophosphorylase (carboxylating)